MSRPLKKLIKSLHRVIHRAELVEVGSEVNTSRLWQAPPLNADSGFSVDLTLQEHAEGALGVQANTVRAHLPPANGHHANPSNLASAQSLVQALYVETNDQYAMAIQAVFEDLGIKGIRAKDGIDLLERLSFWKGKLPQLVVFNLAMNRLDGFGTLEMIRRSPHTRNLRVVVIGSGRNFHPRTLECLEQADAYLERPQNALEMQTKFRVVIEKLAPMERP